MKALIIHDKLPSVRKADEQDTIIQVTVVSKALNSLGFETSSIALSLNFEDFIQRVLDICPDFIFNLVESIDGNGQLLPVSPMLIDHIKIPYTGSSAETLYLTTNKLLAKGILRDNSISTPQWFSPVARNKNDNIIEGQPYIIKSVWEHASLGVMDDSIVVPENTQGLLNEVKSREKRMGKRCFAEHYIDGREFNLSIIEEKNRPRLLPIAEIRFKNYPTDKWRIVDYSAKWHTESFEYQNTICQYEFPPEDSSLLSTISGLTVQCWETFNIKGYARIDFRVDSDGNPWVIDINANPCIAPDSGFVAAGEQAGFSYNQIIEWIVDASIS